MPSLNLDWEWTSSTILALVALVVAGLSYRRARSADKRAGAVLVEAEITGHPSFKESFYGRTLIKLTNTGPAIATKVTVMIWESKEDTEIRAEHRGWRHRLRLHRTKGPERLGIKATKEILAVGLTDNPRHVWVSWHDAAGRHSIHPEPYGPLWSPEKTRLPSRFA